jgi:hypothetical protein
MIERTIGLHPGTPLSADLTWIVAEIREDQEVLRGLLAGLDVKESPVKKAGAWLAEKAGRLKLGDPGEDALGRLEMLETLALGIQGKVGLWVALQRVRSRHPALAGVDFPRLQARAREQHARVEAHRVEAAAEAL